MKMLFIPHFLLVSWIFVCFVFWRNKSFVLSIKTKERLLSYFEMDQTDRQRRYCGFVFCRNFSHIYCQIKKKPGDVLGLKLLVSKAVLRAQIFTTKKCFQQLRTQNLMKMRESRTFTHKNVQKPKIRL